MAEHVGAFRTSNWKWSRRLRTFQHTATQAAFLLGGIGTGNVSLGSRGELRDWEIFNQPNKGGRLANTYFGLWTRAHGQDPDARVLEAELQPPFNQSNGIHPRFAGGLPRLRGATLYGEYPLVGVTFHDDSLPVAISLEAYTPFIPLNPSDSGLPCAILRYAVKNRVGVPVDVTIAGSLMNPLGTSPAGSETAGCHVNEMRDADGVRGLLFRSDKIAADSLQYGTMALVTPDSAITAKPYWLRGTWYDEVQEFWADFASDGRLTDLGYSTPSPDGKAATGSLGIMHTLAPGEEQVFTFILAWYFPNRPRGWWEEAEGAPSPTIRNHYATQFGDAWDVASYVVSNAERLERETLAFHEAMFSSSLPVEVLDAVTANITVLRSPTCFWLESGQFVGWEGCRDKAGCCHGSCNHVWNYAQTVAYLFPSLERSMRSQELGEEMGGDGKVPFRIGKVFSPTYQYDKVAAIDGQLGIVMRLYREWKLSGDSDFLAALWGPAKQAIEYVWRVCDTDHDFVLDGEQHNTYDIEFYGPNPLTGLFFVGALRAAAEMAIAMDDSEAAYRYGEAARTGAERLVALTWNGEYFQQNLPDVNAHKYQFGQGCLSDQLLAQTAAHLYGLGYLLPSDKVRSAIEAVFRYNYLPELGRHANVQRAYAFNDEPGLLLCSWPRGGRPELPFVYSDEVWTGIEYQVATHLVYEGLLDEAFTIVRAVRQRHDGVKRNPWNEVECGHHYVRSMSSWGLLVAMSGFQCNMAKREMSFAPVVDGPFSTFWSTGLGWGTYRQYRDPETGHLVPEVRVMYGDMSGCKVRACGREWSLSGA